MDDSENQKSALGKKSEKGGVEENRGPNIVGLALRKRPRSSLMFHREKDSDKMFEADGKRKTRGGGERTKRESVPT